MDDDRQHDFTPQKHFEDFANQSQLSQRARRHLTAMYGHLAVTFTMALFACYLQVTGAVSAGSGMLPVLGGAATLWSMSRVENDTIRQLMLYGFGFLEGLGLAPMVDMMYYLQPTVLLSILAMTVLIFVSFTGTALFSPRRSHLYLGGIISTGMSLLLASTVLSVFMNSSIIDNISIYGGLLVFALLITFDTQMVVERVESGRRADAVMDAANMLINIVAIVRRLIVIMAQQQQQGSRQRRQDKRRKS